MKTASHYTYFGPGRVVISIGNPRGIPGGYRMFKKLAPQREWMHAPLAEYKPLFKRFILDPLDPQKTWDEIHALVPPGVEPVIACFEKPPFSDSNFCHRRQVAEWFEATLGHKVDELPASPRHPIT
jgi:hypothetical protein